MKVLKGFKLAGLLSIMLISGLGLSVATADEVPMSLSYQCNLASALGEGLTEVDLSFYLYSGSEVNPVTISTFQKDDAKVVNGIVSITLDDTAKSWGVSLSNASKNARLLGIKINGGNLMKPLAELTTSMYAVRARYADRISEDVDLSNVILPSLDANLIPGTAINDESITGSKIKDGSITEDDLANNAFSGKNIQTNFSPVDGSTTLNVNDQGIILAEGQSTITLEEPTPANKGQKYTIKKTDDTIQRPCLENNTCDINAQTNYVTIKCLPDSGSLTSIEGRTSEIHLFYKNSYVTLISDGELWHIIGSNPPQDIFPPVPGNFGVIEDVDLKAGAEVTLTWTEAEDCDLRSCDSCSKCGSCGAQLLKYMPYYSKGEKLTTLNSIRDYGIPCLTTWITGLNQGTMVAQCSPIDKDNYDGAFKVNVVVKDRYGNEAVYCPPGDNTPPQVAGKQFWTSPTDGQGLINLLWTNADDTYNDTVEGTPSGQLQYAVYYIKISSGEYAQAQACLTSININNLQQGCNIQTIGPAVPTDVQADPTKIRVSPTSDVQSTVDITGLGTGTFYITIVAIDNAANTTQYQVQTEDLK